MLPILCKYGANIFKAVRSIRHKYAFTVYHDWRNSIFALLIAHHKKANSLDNFAVIRKPRSSLSINLIIGNHVGDSVSGCINIHMNMNRPDMTEDVKYKDYTNESLQMDSNLATMEMSKSPAIGSSDQTKAAKHEPLVYRVEEIAQLLAISPRAAYNLCNTTKDFRVLRIGTSIRVNKQSFDNWFAAV